MKNTYNTDAELIESNQPGAAELRGRYGELERLRRTFGVSNQAYCAENMGRAVEVGVPRLSVFIDVYGLDNMASLLGVHIADAVASLSVAGVADAADVGKYSLAVCNNERLRAMRLSTIVGFFYLLKTGAEPLLDKPTPRGVAGALERYADGAIVTERCYERVASAPDAADDDDAGELSECVLWEEYCLRNNLGNVGAEVYYRTLLDSGSIEDVQAVEVT